MCLQKSVTIESRNKKIGRRENETSLINIYFLYIGRCNVRIYGLKDSYHVKKLLCVSFIVVPFETLQWTAGRWFFLKMEEKFWLSRDQVFVRSWLYKVHGWGDSSNIFASYSVVVYFLLTQWKSRLFFKSELKHDFILRVRDFSVGQTKQYRPKHWHLHLLKKLDTFYNTL